MTVAGTGGTYTLGAVYTSSGNSFSSNLTWNVTATPQWSASSVNGSFPSQLSCVTFQSDAGAAIQYKITASGVTGTPTARYSITLMLLNQ